MPEVQKSPIWPFIFFIALIGVSIIYDNYCRQTISIVRMVEINWSLILAEALTIVSAISGVIFFFVALLRIE